MKQKDFKNKSEMQIFLSYFKPHRKLFFTGYGMCIGNCYDRSGISIHFQMVYV